METNLLDRMLSTYLASQTPVTITLQNKIRISGKIKAFDSYIIMLESQKREIVYRHAVSCLASDESKKASLPVKTIMRTQKTAVHKTKQPQTQPSLISSPSETGINNSMKEGLLRWIQEQKAAK